MSTNDKYLSSSDKLCLTGQLLIAMPGIIDERFDKTLIYICEHSDEGAMGLVVNREITSLSFINLLKQLNIDAKSDLEGVQLRFGGPVETGRGFVLHSNDYYQDGTFIVNDTTSLTASKDIIQDVALGNGPKRFLLTLGYSGWGPGQLDREFRFNGWLNVDPDEELVFGQNLSLKWKKSLSKLGINSDMLSVTSGRA